MVRLKALIYGTFAFTPAEQYIQSATEWPGKQLVELGGSWEEHVVSHYDSVHPADSEMQTIF